MELPVACGLRPCDWTNRKMALCYIRTLVKRMINTAHFFLKKHPRACSGVRSGAWLHKMNNGRLEAVRLPALAGLPPSGRAALLTPFVTNVWH